MFEENITHLNQIFDIVKSYINEEIMQNDPQVQRNVIRSFNILRGLFKGALTNRSFSILFDWFYPQYFGIIRKCIQAYITNEKLMRLIFKFLGDLLNNTSNRIRFDAWNVNGLIVFKEAQGIMKEYMILYDCLDPKQKQIKQDIYSELYQFLKILM